MHSDFSFKRECCRNCPTWSGEVKGITLPLHLVSEPQIEIKLFDAPIWIPDEGTLSKISAFGTQIGDVRHGFVRTQAGAKISTGVRYGNFRLHTNKHIPSYIRTTSGAGAGKSIALRVMTSAHPQALQSFPDMWLRTVRIESKMASTPHPGRNHRFLGTISHWTVGRSAVAQPPTSHTAVAVTPPGTPPLHTYASASRVSRSLAPEADITIQAAATSSPDKSQSGLVSTPQAKTVPFSFATQSRGKSSHESPDIDDQGFQLARGKHTFPKNLLPNIDNTGIIQTRFRCQLL